MAVPRPPIINCHQWDARPPKIRPIVVGRPNKIIVHHTDGHGPTPKAQPMSWHIQAVEMAKMLQNDMMDRRGWDDSGHNFLVMRSGLIIQGRWGSIAAIERGRMVVSAHCPGENTNPGIEHEHLGLEEMTAQQWESTVKLHAWICDKCGISPTQLYGHDVFFPTSCPANLKGKIPQLRANVATYINEHKRSKYRRGNKALTKLAVRRERH